MGYGLYKLYMYVSVWKTIQNYYYLLVSIPIRNREKKCSGIILMR